MKINFCTRHSGRMKSLRKASWLLIVWLLSACQSAPLAPYRDSAEFDVRRVQGAPFLHQLVLNARARQESKRGFLNVYIEGDGRPWHQRNVVAWDPTPPFSLMMDLMAQDEGAALFLGRPCYFASEDPACEPIWWTHQRFAPEIVQSMDTILDAFAMKYAGIRLIGHSGGGALAMLLAARRDDVVTVVTLAGNADIASWAALHAYSPLKGSLNPRDFPLPAAIQQFHFVGEQDSITPPAWIASVLQRPETLRVLEGMDHRCCWTEVWPGILRQIAASDAP